MKKNQKGFATILALVLIVSAFGIGIFFEKKSKAIDHPAEQLAEKVLKEQGINIDFSKSKKEKAGNEAGK